MTTPTSGAITSGAITPGAVPVVLTPARVAELRRTWELVAPMADEAAQLFYERLFEIDPSLRVLFQSDPVVRRRKLMDALAFVVTHVDRPDDLVAMLAALGHRHVGYGVRPEHYAAAGEALLWTLDEGVGALRTAEAREAWVVTYELISAVMRGG
jgi:hemoglobin-like flavoprotein